MSRTDAPMKCRLGFPKEDQAIIFRKAGLVTFRLVQSPLYALLRAASSGLGGPVCSKI